MKQCADYRIADDGEESANEQESKLSEETRRKHMRLASRVQNFLGCLQHPSIRHLHHHHHHHHHLFALQ